MISIKIPLIGIAAYSGTGKTTLLTKLISIFRQHDLRVGVIKHAHHSFEIDYPGKDSYELRKAGACQVLIGSKKHWALLVDTEADEGDKSLEYHIKHLDLDNLDLILVEGFKPEAIAKIELHRPSLGKPLLFPEDDSIIAIATDSKDRLETKLPVLNLNDPKQIADFIISRFLSDHKNFTTNCK